MLNNEKELVEELRNAIILNKKEKVSELLQNGANPNLTDKYGRTALHYATDFGQFLHLEIIKSLLNHSPNIIDTQDRSGESALHIACTAGHYKIAQILVKKSKINLPNELGQTSLHKAVLKRHENIRILLIAETFSQNLKDNFGLSSLDYRQILPIRTTLYRKASRIHIYPLANETRKVQYIMNFDVETSKYMEDIRSSKKLNLNSDIKFIDLYQGIENNERKLVYEFRVCNFFVKELKEYENTAQQELRNSKLNKLVKKRINFLLEPFNISLTIPTSTIDTTEHENNVVGNDLDKRLCKLAKNGNINDPTTFDQAKEYLESIVNVNYANKTGRTALHCAAKTGKLKLVKMLSDHCEIDINIRDNFGNTALHLACNKNHLSVATLLCDNNAKLNIQNIYQQTALHTVVKEGKKEFVKLLLDQGADTSIKDSLNLKPIEYIKEINDSKERSKIKALIKDYEKYGNFPKR